MRTVTCGASILIQPLVENIPVIGRLQKQKTTACPRLNLCHYCTNICNAFADTSIFCRCEKNRDTMLLMLMLVVIMMKKIMPTTALLEQPHKQDNYDDPADRLV